ncbi:pickpocket protein 28-like [Culicoides brevitarsis]|uniref:pickpocket protein 28-like n=1 Tax=Culicoides brevitarsis TaxID=469753 RepID=UPI00307B20A7
MFQNKNLPYEQYKAKGIPSKGWSYEDGYENEFDADVYPYRGSSLTKQLELQLRLQMNVNDFSNSKSQTVKFVETKKEDLKWNYEEVHGFWVYIGNPMDYPNMEESKTFIPLNSRMTLNIEPDHYTHENCFLECRVKLSKAFECVPFFAPSVDNISICEESLSYNVYSINDRLVKDLHQMSNMNFTNLQCNCFPSCSSIMYNVHEVMTGSIPILNNTFRYSEVTVKFSSPNFLAKRRQESYSILDLLSAFGGLLGLFVGASVMSIMELIFFFTVKIGIDLLTKKH